MFKAKLIDNERYYSYRSRQLIILVIAYLVLIPVFNFFELPTWLNLCALVIYVGVLVLMFKNQNMMNTLLGNRIVEISGSQIKIKNLSKAKEETIMLDEVERLILMEEYMFPMEELEAIGKELSGKAKKNYLIVEQNGRSRKLHFEIESYYMINQLNKLIQTWKQSGLNIQIEKSE
jgi:hypothetical protein